MFKSMLFALMVIVSTEVFALSYEGVEITDEVMDTNSSVMQPYNNSFFVVDEEVCNKGEIPFIKKVEFNEAAELQKDGKLVINSFDKETVFFILLGKNYKELISKTEFYDARAIYIVVNMYANTNEKATNSEKCKEVVED